MSAVCGGSTWRSHLRRAPLLLIPSSPLYILDHPHFAFSSHSLHIVLCSAAEVKKKLLTKAPRSKLLRKKMGTATCVDIILAILLPPLGVFLRFGCKVEFWICLLLTILGYIPGIIYAIYILTK